MKETQDEVAHDEPYYKIVDHLALPVPWLSPEVLSTYEFSEYSDVWAFGVTLIEVYKLGSAPYDTMRMQQIQNYVKGGDVIPKPTSCPQGIYNDIITRCFAFSPTDRPRFGVITAMLETVANGELESRSTDTSTRAAATNGLRLDSNIQAKFAQNQTETPDDVRIGYHGGTDGNAVPIVENSSDGVIPDTNVSGYGTHGGALDHEQKMSYGFLPNTQPTQDGSSMGATNNGHFVAVANRESIFYAVGGDPRFVGSTSPHNQGLHDTATSDGEPPLALDARSPDTSPLQPDSSTFVNSSLQAIENYGATSGMVELHQQSQPSTYEDMSSELFSSADHGIARINETTTL
jgi:hypothetical protein